MKTRVHPIAVPGLLAASGLVAAVAVGLWWVRSGSRTEPRLAPGEYLELLHPEVHANRVILNGAASFQDRIEWIEWNWADGQVTRSPFPGVHAYRRSGAYPVSVTARSERKQVTRTVVCEVREVHPPPTALHRYRYIARACGAIDGVAKTHSREALQFHYSHGLRLFGVSPALLQDGELVCFAPRHEPFIRWDRPIEEIPVETFRRRKYLDRFTPLTVRDLLEWMGQQEDAHVVLDTGGQSREAIQALARLLDEFSPEVRARVTPQFASREEWALLTEFLAPRTGIFDLGNSLEGRPEVRDFARENRIAAVALPLKACYPGFVHDLNRDGILVFVHTVNDPATLRELLRAGVHGVYTDLAYDAPGLEEIHRAYDAAWP